MLIGLTGLKGSGKSTVAGILEARGFARWRMAGILKDMLRTLGLTEAEIEGIHKEEPCELLGGQTPRFAMQTLGTEWGRILITEDLWVRAMRRRLERNQHVGDIVIEDVRFPNEVALVKDFGGLMWRVSRPGTSCDGHASEKDIDSLEVDRTFYNVGTTYDLRVAIERHLARLVQSGTAPSPLAPSTESPPEA